MVSPPPPGRRTCMASSRWHRVRLRLRLRLRVRVKVRVRVSYS